MKLNNKVVVVTGAGSGIGAELARLLLDRGAKVAAVDVNEDSLQQLKHRVGSHADRLSIHTVSISDREAVATLPDAVLQAHGQIDGLINCAGIIQPFVKVNELDYDAIERVMHVNFYGTLYMTKAFLPHLLQRPAAHIVNVSSMGGFLPVPGQSVYGASKAAVKLLTEGLYAELLDTQVRVTIAFPGATNTNIAKNSRVAAPNLSKADIAKQTSRMLSPTKAAEMILNGMERNKPQIFTGSDSKLMNRLYRINPTFATKFIAKRMHALLASSK